MTDMSQALILYRKHQFKKSDLWFMHSVERSVVRCYHSWDYASTPLRPNLDGANLVCKLEPETAQAWGANTLLMLTQSATTFFKSGLKVKQFKVVTKDTSVIIILKIGVLKGIKCNNHQYIRVFEKWGAIIYAVILG